MSKAQRRAGKLKPEICANLRLIIKAFVVGETYTAPCQLADDKKPLAFVCWSKGFSFFSLHPPLVSDLKLVATKHSRFSYLKNVRVLLQWSRIYKDAEIKSKGFLFVVGKFLQWSRIYKDAEMSLFRLCKSLGTTAFNGAASIKMRKFYNWNELVANNQGITRRFSRTPFES